MLFSIRYYMSIENQEQTVISTDLKWQMLLHNSSRVRNLFNEESTYYS